MNGWFFHMRGYKTSHTFCRPIFLLRKEVIQPQVLLRLPCYDFTPIISSAFDCCLNIKLLAHRLRVFLTLMV